MHPKLDQDGYAVIPPSGTFRDLIGELDFIIGELGCRILLLLPIHPTPTTYGRMGRFGSPYAALSFTAVDPALAEFDPHHSAGAIYRTGGRGSSTQCQNPDRHRYQSHRMGCPIA